ncbi:MAG: cycloartenol synthase, partial [Akkermansiaceae bacterium]|nr:cycloartenol synthase [Akkermansiaceae bacterium]
MRDPGSKASDKLPSYLEKGYRWMLGTQKDDGGIYVKGLASYNTSSAIMALLARGRESDEPA